MPRSGNAVFVRDNKEKDSKTSFCEKCKEEKGRIVKLVPRILDDKTIDDHFKLCPNCTEIIPIHEAMLESEYTPKGHISESGNPFDSGTKVSVIRNKRTNKANMVESIEEIQVPKIAGKPDTELEEVLRMKDRPAILNCLNDVVVET